MGTRWPRSGSYEFDDNGDRAPGALASFFAAGTSTPYVVYQDADETTPHENPVEADGNGRWPAVFIPYGTYKELIETAGGTELFEMDDVPNPAPFTDDFELDETAILNTGDFIFTGKNGTRTGAVRCNGRTIGNAASGATERANADTVDLYTYLYDNYDNAQCPVTGGRGSNAASDYAANKSIAMPDYRSVALVGFDDMGNSAAGLVASAPVVTGSGTAPGSVLGANTHTILTAHLPVTTPAGSINQVTGTISQITPAGSISQITPAGSVNDSRTWSFAWGRINNIPIGGTSIASQNSSLGIATMDQTQTVSASGSIAFSGTPVTPTFTGTPTTPTFTGGTPTFTGTPFGSGTAHNIMQRSAPVTVLMKL